MEAIDVTQAIIHVKDFLHNLQNRICSVLELQDGKAKFIEDIWSHQHGGGGRTRALAYGDVIEKAGVNFSHVHGIALPPAATLKRPDLEGRTFQALGVSTIIHPRNPYAPTSHMNVRFIVAEKPGEPAVWWFGGGFDLTPYYGFTDDCILWHDMARKACEPFGVDVYPRYKKWCDEYFYLKNRNEPRGIGGLFFDDLNEWGFDHCFSFMRNVGDYFIEGYEPILARRKDTPYSERERDFQCFRRGRYVEFNLLYDRGTLFGIQTGGRMESILLSLPPLVKWEYQYPISEGSKEAELYREYLVVREWKI